MMNTLNADRLNQIICSDALNYLRTLPDQCVNCVVTSPPYFGLRDYGIEGQIGRENTVEEYVNALMQILDEVQRILRADGVLWLNLGDSYFKRTTKAKSLMMIPARVALALLNRDWLLRAEIVWSKPDPNPESITDRPTRAHEMIYLLTKGRTYYYDADAIKEPSSPVSIARVSQKTFTAQKGGSKDYGKSGINPSRSSRKSLENFAKHPEYRNSRSVWTIPKGQTKYEHFATYPPELARRCILAGSKIGDVVLDPFIGSGTTALVARHLNRQYIGCDLNPSYVQLAQRRLAEPYQTELFYHAG